MSNRRVYYAVQRVDFAPNSAGNVLTAAHGVQSVGLNTAYNLEQAFQLGQFAVYENIEGFPSVELTCDKLLDGYPPLYLLGTRDATVPTLAGRSAAQTMIYLGIWNDTDTGTAGTTPKSAAQVSGAFPSAVSYEFPVDGNFRESTTWVANDIIWANSYAGAPDLSAWTFDASFSESDQPLSTSGGGGINRRENLNYLPTGTQGNFNLPTGAGIGGPADTNGIIRDKDVTVLPRVIPGIDISGLNRLQADGTYSCHTQRISCSSDFGREDLFELGRRGPYFRYLPFPVEVRAEVECYASSGSFVSATQLGIYQGNQGQCTERYNLTDNTFRVATCEGLRVFLGKKVKLSSINYGGGDAGGGNANNTFSFQTYNDFTVMHYNDPNALLRPSGFTTGFNYLAPS